MPKVWDPDLQEWSGSVSAEVSAMRGRRAERWAREDRERAARRPAEMAAAAARVVRRSAACGCSWTLCFTYNWNWNPNKDRCTKGHNYSTMPCEVVRTPLTPAELRRMEPDPGTLSMLRKSRIVAPEPVWTGIAPDSCSECRRRLRAYEREYEPWVACPDHEGAGPPLAHR